MEYDVPKLAEILRGGGVAVIPTDTIYGIVGRAEETDTVERIYDIKRRQPEKPCIILIADANDLGKFTVSLTDRQKEETEKYWPGPVSIILDCPDEKLAYLHRGTRTLAFRMPDSPGLRRLISETGPLVAPSANPEDQPPAKNIEEAKEYFGDKIDYYLDGGDVVGKPSKVIALQADGTINVLRN